MTRPQTSAMIALTLAISSCCIGPRHILDLGPPHTGAPGLSGPNFLFIIADQHRADALGKVDSRVVTPNLDRLADEGIRFANCYTPQSICSPCRASILTGRYPHDHGLFDLVRNDDDVSSVFNDLRYDMTPNWPQTLHEAGYVTAYIGKWHLGYANPGFFDVWKGYNTGEPHWLGPEQICDYRSDIETEAAIRFLESHQTEPFVLFLSYYPPHDEHDDEYTPPREFERHYTGSGLAPLRYYAAVTAIDSYVGRLLEALDRLHLRNDTVVIYTSEHGDTFGRRPGSVHKGVCYDDSAKIPLIISDPTGALALPAGSVYESGITSCDLMPTILELAGLTPPAEGLHGRSLVARLTAPDDWADPVFIQNITNTTINGGRAIERAVRTEEWKLIVRRLEIIGPTPAFEFYNMTTDPAETSNLFDEPAHQSVVLNHCQLLEDWGHEVADVFAVKLARAARAAAE